MRPMTLAAIKVSESATAEVITQNNNIK